ncbi:hypothetical protein NC651_017287 [Populus alba x Populus x berolinensis]|nr:hypothetical protein NC651_017287 [Populus alba x Populus x berolinensis]
MSELMVQMAMEPDIPNSTGCHAWRCERLDEVWIVFWNCKAMRYRTLKHVSSLKLDPVQIIQNHFLLFIDVEPSSISLH